MLLNDTDPDGDRLTAELIQPSANGTVALNPDGSFTYMPNLNFTGLDGFSYRVRMGWTTQESWEFGSTWERSMMHRP